jgi:hypothetical protein
MNQMRTLNE